jgi:hypothetical protein
MYDQYCSRGGSGINAEDLRHTMPFHSIWDIRSSMEQRDSQAQSCRWGLAQGDRERGADHPFPFHSTSQLDGKRQLSMDGGSSGTIRMQSTPSPYSLNSGRPAGVAALMRLLERYETRCESLCGVGVHAVYWEKWED